MKSISIDVTPCTSDKSLSTLTNCEQQSIPLINIGEIDNEMTLRINSVTAFAEKSIKIVSHKNPSDNFDVSEKVIPLRIEDEQKKL